MVETEQNPISSISRQSAIAAAVIQRMSLFQDTINFLGHVHARFDHTAGFCRLGPQAPRSNMEQ